MRIHRKEDSGCKYILIDNLMPYEKLLIVIDAREKGQGKLSCPQLQLPQAINDLDSDVIIDPSRNVINPQSDNFSTDSPTEIEMSSVEEGESELENIKQAPRENNDDSKCCYLTDGTKWAAYKGNSYPDGKAMTVSSAEGAYVYRNAEEARKEKKRCKNKFKGLTIRMRMQKTVAKEGTACVKSEEKQTKQAQPAKNQRKTFSKKERKNIYRKTEGRCYICGDFVDYDLFEIEHFVPLGCGGTNDIKNLYCSCHACNVLKGSLTPEQFFAKIKRISENTKKLKKAYKKNKKRK